MSKNLNNGPIDITYIHAKTGGLDMGGVLTMLTNQLRTDKRLANVEPSVTFNNDGSEVIIVVNAKKGGKIPVPPKFLAFVLGLYSDDEISAVHDIVNQDGWIPADANLSKV